jgi:hypothetical protein
MSTGHMTAALLVIIIGISVAAVCLAGARKKGGRTSFNRTVLYTMVALIIALLIWLATMVLFVGPALQK